MIAAVLLAAILDAPLPAAAWGGPPAAPPLEPVPARELRVTQGELRPDGAALRVEGPRVRAEARGRSGDRAELRFTYLGPSATTVALASGEPRRQLGVKLRAQDGCNLLYAMWRIAPEPEIVVQLKRNGGQRSSRACGNGGYRTLPAAFSLAVAPPAPGEARVLRADVEGGRIAVRVDGRLVWEGELPPEAEELSGPVGLRTDNARARLVLAASPRGGAGVVGAARPADDRRR